MLVTALAIPTSALDGICGEAEGTMSNNLTWRYDETTKTLIIEGSGAMKEWRNCSLVPWKNIREDVEHISLPEGLTSIGNYAFFKFKNLKEINIPSTVKTIGNGSISVCSSLTEVTVPYGVNLLGGWCFASCTSLENINLPSSLKTISYECFLNCPLLMDVTIPSSVTSIQGYAFGLGVSHRYYYDMVLRGVSGSVVESYANNNMLNFVATNRAIDKSAFTSPVIANAAISDMDSDYTITVKDLLLTYKAN